MPEVPARRVPGLTRRQGLTAAALLGPVGLLAACSSAEAPQSGASAASTATGRATDPTGEVTASEQDLIDRYDCVIAAFPALGTPLAALRDQHRQHAAALSGASPGSSASVTAPASEQAALHMLITAEREAMHQRIAACMAAQDPALARTLAFIAASEGSHVPALRDLRA
jgi:hypothetical protein